MSRDALTARLRALDTCAVSDAMDRLGGGAVIAGLAALTVPARIAGRVVTVDLGPPGTGTPSRHLGTAAVEASGPDDVIVVAHGGRVDCAGWGGLLSQAAARRGIAGVVVDGASRDIDEARAVGLPVYARCGTPTTARGRAVERSWAVPVEVAGHRVAPGDYVIADASGVVFLPADLAAGIVESATRIAAREAEMAAAVRAGVPVSRVMGGDYETMLAPGTHHGK